MASSILCSLYKGMRAGGIRTSFSEINLQIFLCSFPIFLPLFNFGNMSRVGPFTFLLFCFSLVALLSVCSGSQPAVVSVDVQAAKDLLASGYRFLDVRSKKEFMNGHVENALNVPFWFFIPDGKEVNPRFIEEVSAVCSKDDKLVVACQCGIRSLDASIELLKAGYKNVRNMEGGYGSWLGNGFSVVRVAKDEL